MELNNTPTFFYPVIEALNKGAVIKKVMSFLFMLIGVLSFVGGVYFFFKTISYVPDFWTIVLLLLLLLYSFLSLQIWFYRAKAIMNLEDSEFIVIPIFSIFFRALGESYAIFIISIGLGGVLMLWFSNYGSFLLTFIQYIPFVPSLNDSFIGGILFLLITIAIAFSILLLTYFIAENILVLVQIAKNTSGLKKVDLEEK